MRKLVRRTRNTQKLQLVLTFVVLFMQLRTHNQKTLLGKIIAFFCFTFLCSFFKFLILFESFFDTFKHSTQFFMSLVLAFKSSSFFLGQMKEASIIEFTLVDFAIKIVPK